MSLAQAFQSKTLDPNIAYDMAVSAAHKIRSVVTPRRLILFGSAVEGNFTETSDLDFLLVFASLGPLREARQAIHRLGKLCEDRSVDLIFVTEEHFNRKKDLGGVCFVAEHEGRDL